MKKMIRDKLKVIIIAATILIVSAGALFTTVALAQGAETNKTIIEKSNYEETFLAAESSPAASNVVPQQTSSEPSPSDAVPQQTSSEPSPSDAVPQQTPGEPSPSLSPESAEASPTPGAECITEDDAENIFIKTATNLFGISIEKSSIWVYFDNHAHNIWMVNSPSCECNIDAVSGAVICFNLSGAYTGEKITLGDSNSNKYSNSYSPSEPADMKNSPDNIYIKAALQLVNAKLSDGRMIDNIQIDGVQFVWDQNPGEVGQESKDSDIGTIQVDCHVYMHTGYSYTLSFWGTENPELRIFSSHPTQDACKWGYFYEEDAAENSPQDSPSPVTTEWYLAPGLEAGATPQPTSMPTP